MAWLFERMIEAAAWVAFILGLVFLADAVILLIQWARSWGDSADTALLAQSGTYAAMFVAAALAVGALACIDRYVFDLPEQDSPSK
jgi:Na+-driven multidrug efflux pump